jgi:hypothetical protein
MYGIESIWHQQIEFMEYGRLSELNIGSFANNDSWMIAEESIEDNDVLLKPAYKIKGRVSKKNGEVWCLSKALFSNGEIYSASSMCRGDSDQGPLLWSVWNGEKYVALIVPPAPDFVLESEGPIAFCNEFARNPEDVFPISFEVVPLFEIEPHKRSLLIGIKGILSI